MGTPSAVFVLSMLSVALCLTPYEREARREGERESRNNDHRQDVSTQDLKKHVLDRAPLIVGSNWLSSLLRENEHNQLKGLDFDSDLTKNPKWNCSRCHTDLPRLRKGKVGSQFWLVHGSCSKQHKDAVEETLEQIDVIRRLIAKYPKDMQFVDSAQGIEAAFAADKIGSLIGIEGGHSLDSRLAVLRIYYLVGVRSLSLAYSCSTPWAGKYGTDRGLTNFGREVVLEMNRLGMIVDLTGASLQTILDAIHTSLGPIIFSHSNAAARCNHGYNVPDEVLQKVKENGGLVMVSFHSAQLCCDGAKATVDDVVAHVNYIRKVAGVDHVGIGSSYNGWTDMPVGLEDVSHFPDLFDRLGNNTVVGPTWTDEDLKKLAGHNMLRVFKEVEKVRDEQEGREILERQPEEGIRNEAREYGNY